MLNPHPNQVDGIEPIWQYPDGIIGRPTGWDKTYMTTHMDGKVAETAEPDIWQFPDGKVATSTAWDETLLAMPRRFCGQSNSVG